MVLSFPAVLGAQSIVYDTVALCEAAVSLATVCTAAPAHCTQEIPSALSRGNFRLKHQRGENGLSPKDVYQCPPFVLPHHSSTSSAVLTVLTSVLHMLHPILLQGLGHTLLWHDGDIGAVRRRGVQYGGELCGGVAAVAIRHVRARRLVACGVKL